MANDSEQKPPQAPRSSRTAALRSSAWAWPVTWICIVLILAAAGLYVFKSLRDLPGETASKTTAAVADAGKRLVELAAAFSRGTVTTSFISYASTLSSSHYLQFANLSQTELFSHSDQATTGFGYIPLPEIIVEARAPVEYTYYLDLNAKWELRLEDQVIYVLAPPIHFNKPSVDASRIEYEVRKDSVFRNGNDAKENLKQSITFLANQKARENVPIVRELGRKKTGEFVEKWLAKTFLDGKRHPVKVFFPGEPLPPAFRRDFPEENSSETREDAVSPAPSRQHDAQNKAGID